MTTLVQAMQAVPTVVWMLRWTRRRWTRQQPMFLVSMLLPLMLLVSTLLRWTQGVVLPPP